MLSLEDVVNSYILMVIYFQLLQEFKILGKEAIPIGTEMSGIVTQGQVNVIRLCLIQTSSIFPGMPYFIHLLCLCCMALLIKRVAIT